MKFTFRIDETGGPHTRFTIFANGANCGQLCMDNIEALDFLRVLSKGCRAEKVPLVVDVRQRDIAADVELLLSEGEVE